jgi:hypothetical protein
MAKRKPSRGASAGTSAWKKKILSKIAAEIRQAKGKGKKGRLRGLNSYYKDGGGIYGKGNFGKSERPRARRRAGARSRLGRAKKT